MIREEFAHEQEVNDDLDLDSDSDVDDGESIIARIQYFLGENDDILRAKDRKQRNRIFRAIHDGKLEVVIDNFIDSSSSASCSCRTEPRPLPTICAHEELWQQGARCSPTGGSVRRPRDGRRTPAALRGGSSERSDALAPAYGAVHELAHAFSLKSTSEGNGAARFTKLVKTMLSGVWADERNVARILVKPRCKGKGREWRGE